MIDMKAADMVIRLMDRIPRDEKVSFLRTILFSTVLTYAPAGRDEEVMQRIADTLVPRYRDSKGMTTYLKPINKPTA